MKSPATAILEVALPEAARGLQKGLLSEVSQPRQAGPPPQQRAAPRQRLANVLLSAARLPEAAWVPLEVWSAAAVSQSAAASRHVVGPQTSEQTCRAAGCQLAATVVTMAALLAVVQKAIPAWTAVVMTMAEVRQVAAGRHLAGFRRLRPAETPRPVGAKLRRCVHVRVEPQQPAAAAVPAADERSAAVVRLADADRLMGTGREEAGRLVGLLQQAASAVWRP